MTNLKQLNILVLEAYDGGSHGGFLDGLIKHSQHNYVRLSLPARKWKWRMRGAAIWFAREIDNIWPDNASFSIESVDLIFTSDMTSVADLKSLLPKKIRNVPVLCYFHENQLTYPLSMHDQVDYQYGFTNITSALAADGVWFNSEYNLSSFLEAAGDLLGKMPDFVPPGVIEDIRRKSIVMPLGLNPSVFEIEKNENLYDCPVILWNHRWEFDKQPGIFFDVLYRLQEEGVDFKVIIAGESFRTWPKEFDIAKDKLAGRIIHFGYAENRQRYNELLGMSDIVLSTAIHEFFGLSVLEAIAAGCMPLLPNRLSYPYLVPPDCHNVFIYDSDANLFKTLKNMILTDEYRNLNSYKSLIEFVASLNWKILSKEYDSALNRILN